MESQVFNFSPVVASDKAQMEDEAFGDQVAMNLVTKGTTKFTDGESSGSLSPYYLGWKPDSKLVNLYNLEQLISMCFNFLIRSITIFLLCFCLFPRVSLVYFNIL